MKKKKKKNPTENYTHGPHLNPFQKIWKLPDYDWLDKKYEEKSK